MRCEKDRLVLLRAGFGPSKNQAKYLSYARCDIFADANSDIFVLRRMRYDINPITPAGISLAAGQYRTQSVYRKSTQWIYIVEKGLAHASPFSGGGDGNRTRVRKPFGTTFSGCRLSFEFPVRRSGRRDRHQVGF